MTTISVLTTPVTVEITNDTVSTVLELTKTALITAVTAGPQGPQGAQGIPAPGVPTFIQATQPTIKELAGYAKYAWWDTSGGDLTLWIEDGI